MFNFKKAIAKIFGTKKETRLALVVKATVPAPTTVPTAHETYNEYLWDKISRESKSLVDDSVWNLIPAVEELVKDELPSILSPDSPLPIMFNDFCSELYDSVYNPDEFDEDRFWTAVRFLTSFNKEQIALKKEAFKESPRRFAAELCYYLFPDIHCATLSQFIDPDDPNDLSYLKRFLRKFRTVWLYAGTDSSSEYYDEYYDDELGWAIFTADYPRPTFFNRDVKTDILWEYLEDYLDVEEIAEQWFRDGGKYTTFGAFKPLKGLEEI